MMQTNFKLSLLFPKSLKQLLSVGFLLFAMKANAQSKGDAILGKWETVEKNLIVQVYKESNIYKAKILWFYDPDKSVPVEQKLDVKNPDESLRSRTIVGIDVLTGMMYNEKQNKYTNGKIYDSSSGKTWSASAKLEDENSLVVRGYYIVHLLGKTMNLKRIN